MKGLRNTSIGLLLVVLLLVLVVIEVLVRSVGVSLQPTPTTEPVVYQVERLPDKWQMLWTMAPITIKHSSNQGSVSLLANAQSAFALEAGFIVKIDMSTGELSRCARIERDTIWGGPRVATLLVNPTHVFVGFSGTQKISGNTNWGAARIEAYNSDSCTLAWSRTIGGARTLDVVIATKDTVSIDGGFASNYYLLDANTGAILETSPKVSPFIWKIEESKEIVYVRTPESSFVAIDQKTREPLWVSPINYGIYQPPVFTDDIVVARIGSTNQIGRVIAINILDGTILWEVENIVSNVAVDETHVFLVTGDTRLIALDLVTGKVISEVNFIPNEVSYSFGDALQVATNNNIVLTYFGNSEQLFAFRFLPD